MINTDSLRVNMVQKCVHIHVNAKMRPIETDPGMREAKIKESSGEVNSNMMYLIHCKHFLKGYNVTHPEQQ
jgi:hypothetical protein